MVALPGRTPAETLGLPHGVGVTLRREFEHPVDRHYGRTASYARYMTGGAGETEDLVRQAFLPAFERLVLCPTSPRHKWRVIPSLSRDLVAEGYA